MITDADADIDIAIERIEVDAILRLVGAIVAESQREAAAQ